MNATTATATRKPTGYILWEGPSLIDGAPIVAIAVTASSNRKTGNMVQTYILRQDVKPSEAVRTGADASICGDCKHRPALGGACYVVVPQGPTVVWKGYHARGIYPLAGSIEALGRGRVVRLGTYGDPAAVPAWVWQALVSESDGHTGYTHQWAQGAQNTPLGLNVRALQALVMASVDSPSERADALAQGWRTFRVMRPGDALERREFECPASEEQGKRRTCATCRACDGRTPGQPLQASVAIVVHGSKASRFIPIRPA